MRIDQKLPGYRFPLSIIGHAVWLYHRYTLSYRDVEELLFERGIEVSRESIRTWCIHCSDEFARGLRHREPRRGLRWHLDEMHVLIVGIPHWLWRAVDENGAVLEVFLQRRRDTDVAKGFFERLLGKYEVPETVCTDKLASYAAAIRELPVLAAVDHRQVISTARHQASIAA
ncbi:MAG: IS6 family transposase [Pleurocapsa sp. SU_196_0]|nr:IS6 family transposase [Pleurocapsa sp. SU_196_0]